MNPSKMRTELQEYSRTCISELNKFNSDFESAVSNFLTSNRKNCLLVETRDTKLGAIRIMHLLEQFKKGQGNEKALGRYLGAENQTFLHWKQLLDTVRSATDLPRFTNLLVCMFPNRESRKIENTEEEIFHKISDRLNIAVLKKIIFITPYKDELNEYLKEIDTNAFLKIDEFENIVTSVIGDGKKALLDKASCGDVNGVEDLLKSAVDVNVTSGEDQLTALYVSAENGHTKVVSTLLKNGAEMLPNKSGDTPLHAAAKNGHTDVVTVLLENDVEVDIGGEKGQTALFAAASNGQTDVIKIMLQYNGNINGQNSEGNSIKSDSPLHAAVKNEHKDIVIMLLENGAEVDIKSLFEQTALHMAATRGQVDVVKTLLKYGANVDAQDDEAHTPIHYSVMMNKMDALHTLLNNKADINAININEHTALHFAISQDNLNSVQILIEKGANVHLKNKVGEGILDFALKSGRCNKDQIVSLLKTKM